MRVVFDVNLLIRIALRSRFAARLLRVALESGCAILTCTDLRDEFAATARKPRLSGRIDWDVYNQMLSTLAILGEQVTIQPPFPSCRDPRDGYLLALAVAGEADYLVTWDQDLLCLGSIGKCQIVKPETFESILGL